MKLATIGLVAALSVTAAGCEGMSDTQRRTATGAGIGAGTGALVGGATGNSMLGGAALGGAAGAGGGYLYDRHEKGKSPF
jgi:osmotically inducible lipoprotein OsmB